MSKSGVFKFSLYIAGDGPNSLLAVANLHEICDKHLPGRHEIEIVDVLRHPRRALDDGVMLTPLLIKRSPEPVRKIVGTLGQREKVLLNLGLP